MPASVEPEHGVRAIPVPVPQPEGVDFTWCYAIDDSDGGIHLVDPGWRSDDNLRHLARELARTGRALEEVRSITITHQHADHLGLADAIREQTGAHVIMHGDEAAALDGAASRRWDVDLLSERMRAWEVPSGDADHILRVLGRRSRPEALVPDQIVRDGDRLPVPGRVIEVVWTPGHTPGHICLADRAKGFVITGDHVLSHSNPGIGLGGTTARNALTDYLWSLLRVSERGERGLPGHEQFIPDLAARARRILRHHLTRTATVSSARAAGARSVWATAAALTWSGGWDSLSPYRRYSALNQIEMHLEAQRSGDVVRQEHGWKVARSALEEAPPEGQASSRSKPV